MKKKQRKKPAVVQMDLMAEVEHFFDSSQVPREGPPTAVIIMGPPASGKTSFRKEKYATGYVVIDSAAVFLQLCHGRSLDFPGPLLEPMELMGQLITNRALSERRNIVTEVIGAEQQPLLDLINALKGIGYRTSVEYIDCDMEEGLRRNAARGPDNISSYFAEKYQMKWLLEACRGIVSGNS
jgi:hypothetical protein